MKKLMIRKLALSCYKNDRLNEAETLKVANLLTHHDLKQFIKVIKSEEDKRTATITSAKALAGADKKTVEEIFTGKTVHFQTDPSLLTGLKVQNADMIYEQSLKNTLEQIRKEVINL
jgi:F0F1-type ATP synthase delta subunit